MAETTPDTTAKRWFVLRDLSRANAKLPGWQRVSRAGLEMFTPMKWVVSKTGARRERRQVPVIHDLLFVHASRNDLDPLIAKTDTLQYRFAKGMKYCEPMTIRDAEMDRFIAAAGSTDSPRYYTPAELTTLALGKRVRIICEGVMNGYEGKLLAVRGARKKRLLVEVPGLLAVVYEISPEFVEVIDN